MSESEVSVDTCDEWRQRHNRNESLFSIAHDNDVIRATVRDHVSGECDHTGNVDPIAAAARRPVGETECTALRRRAATGESPDSLAEETGRRWKTLVKHLSGNCEHPDTEGVTVARETLLERTNITAEQCAAFRDGVEETGNVLAYAKAADHEYQTVLRHVNGECNHDVDIPPRERRERSNDVSESECAAIRDRYREGPDVTLEMLADEFSLSRGTVERHIRFTCSHPPGDLLVTSVDEVQDLLEETMEPETTYRPESVASLDSVTNGDPTEAAADLATPEPERVETTQSRVVRNTALAREVKALYGHSCQLCGDVRRGPGGDPYAEAHHIRPLGAPHDGPDELENVLVLCPNHHADFDYGRVVVDPETLTVRHQDEPAVEGEELTVVDSHDISSAHLQYHAETIASQEQS
ncbi:HNH endonuclease [Haloferax prahovense]|uniref:HNH endonuclease n=1 Tax=Haloferax prahovense TaxID=381852 RepID=UPI001C92BDDF|nr:HNH endonuclease [Haloferax prahovense]